MNTRERTVDQKVRFAFGHWVRVEVLCLLNEGTYSAQELAKVMGCPLSTVSHHVEELLKDGSIEIARTKRVRNITQNFYRAAEIPFLSDADMEALDFDTRQEIYGLILSASVAEALASFSSGKISRDPRTVLAWSWFNVDQQGREEIASEQARSWERIRTIEAQAASRRARSGAEAKSIIVASFGFERCRTFPTAAAHARGKLAVS